MITYTYNDFDDIHVEREDEQASIAYECTGRVIWESDTQAAYGSEYAEVCGVEIDFVSYLTITWGTGDEHTLHLDGNVIDQSIMLALVTEWNGHWDVEQAADVSGAEPYPEPTEQDEWMDFDPDC